MVVSICAPCPVSTRRPTPLADRGLHSVDQVGKVAAEAVELPDDEHGARSARAHAAVESLAVVAGTGREVVVDVDGIDVRGLQRIARQVQRLGAVRLRDAGVADQHVWDRRARAPSGERRRVSYPVSNSMSCIRRARVPVPCAARARRSERDDDP